MVRGTITFKCDECGNKFEGLDIEMGASIYSAPQPCPACGSNHTMPDNMFGRLGKPIYKKVWEDMDKQK